MKKICIKTNNQLAINYLLENLEIVKLRDVHFLCKKFKTFNNIIIFYKGKNLDLFLCSISELLSSLVMELYETDILYQILTNEYFYFNNIEKNDVLDKLEDICIDDEDSYIFKEQTLFDTFFNFLKENDKLYLKGFITFRLCNYVQKLQSQVDTAVNQYLIEKEYNEFVSLLRLYVNTEIPQCDELHLIYKDGSPILLDENKNIIQANSDLFKAKYLSDISFSEADFALNTILNIIPQKLYIHLIDNEIDEFINTLELIFEKRAVVCTDCNICRIYRSKRNRIKERF